MTLFQWSIRFNIQYHPSSAQVFVPSRSAKTNMEEDFSTEAWLYSLTDYIVRSKTTIGYWLIPR